MRKKLGLLSSIITFAVVLTVVFPHVSLAGTKTFTVNNTTSSKPYDNTFTHNNPKASCTDSPAKFTNNMRVTLGAVTNSSIKVNNHNINITSLSGTLWGGRSYLQSTAGASRTTLYGTKMARGGNYGVTWNETMPISSSARSVTATQYFFPSNYLGSDLCQDTDNMIFTHGGLSSLSNDNELLSSTININSPKVQELADNVKQLGFNNMGEFTHELGYTKAFILGDKLLDISIHDNSIKIADAIDIKTYGNSKVYTAENIEGVNVYTLEIPDNDQYIYLTSTAELEDLLTLMY